MIASTVIVTWLSLAVCSVAVQGCPDGWTKYGYSCYLYVADKYTWFDAKEACNVMKASLVEIDSAAENSFVSNMLPRNTAAWIGLEDFAVENHFVWTTTGEAPEYTHWLRGEPNNLGNQGEDCATIINGGWNDLHCDLPNMRAGFVCERPVHQ